MAKYWCYGNAGAGDRPHACNSTAATATCRVPDRARLGDARIMRIYGGTNEIMKEMIGRAMGLVEPSVRPSDDRGRSPR